MDVRWRLLLSLGILALCAYVVYPPATTIHLGLDLKGGIHMVLRVKTDDAVKAEIDLSTERIRAALGEKGLAPEKIAADGTDSMLLSGVEAARLGEASDLLKTQFPQYQVASPGGNRLRLTLRASDEAAIRDSAVRQALETIRTRVDKFGVAEPTIQRQGVGAKNDRILVQLPGVEDPERVKDLIGSPAFLEWKLVKVPPGVTAGQFRPPDKPELVAPMFGGTLPDDVEVLPQDTTTTDGRPAHFYWPVTKSSPITGNDLKNARRDQDKFGGPAVNFVLTAEAGRRFQDLTRQNLEQLLAIVLDRRVISAPKINAVIADRGIIEGSFSIEQAEDLSLKLRSGALPAGMEILEERTVGPSLGADSVRQGIVASALGSLIVVLFMLVYYRLSGINAVLALVLNLLILLAAMAYLRSTLTLPGIAGIALTVGMAVDANVLVFERIREEVRLGRNVKSSIHAGFDKALSTIVDSNLTTLIAGFFLYAYGSGPVKGFAVTLNVGILANLFTAVFVSRAIFDTALAVYPRAERLSI
ncbi:MAG TPA: protein translocase subunit SecD [Candidatus Polarisedimenticolia bacterium]|nr:protein translocase subunit SecD [Candidatus Polarisedimenticolia bacterium]